jgi:hypothetical protein
MGGMPGGTVVLASVNVPEIEQNEYAESTYLGSVSQEHAMHKPCP